MLVRLQDLKKEANSEISIRVENSVAPSHTEALSISAILSLDSNAFSDMLSENYKLIYYEIHFISYLDACDKCPKVICQNIGQIKSHFNNNNLFVFYHADNHYESNNKSEIPYTLTFKDDKKWNFIGGRMSTYQYIYIKEGSCPAKGGQKYNLKGSNNELCSFDSIPNFYFSFIYDLESDDPDRMKAARRIMFE